MADNTTQASWEAGDVIATDDLVTLNGEVVSGESFVLSVRSTAAVNLTLNATITYIEAA